MKKIVCFGPGPIFKGGIANYNCSLAKAFALLPGTEVYIVSWTQQYPAFIPRDFIDRKSQDKQLEGTSIQIFYITNYNKPSSWRKTVRQIKDINPDIVIFQWAIAIQGLPMGTIAAMLRRQTKAEIIFDLHFVIQKEGSRIDKWLTRYGIRHAHSYVVHSEKTARELEHLFPHTSFACVKKGRNNDITKKTIITLFHPVYDMFKPDVAFNKEKIKNELKLHKHVFLFFGFIRKYKGLHNAIEAFRQVLKQRQDVSLLIVGESFWNTLDSNKLSTKIKQALFGVAKKLLLSKKDDERSYNPLLLIDKYKMHDYVTVVNEFVPNEEVHKYFQVSDSILLFYLTATPSGVESIAYNFRLPILATAVGHFPETIRHGYNGYIAPADDINAMTQAMLLSIEKPIPDEHIAETAKYMSWENYAKAILDIN